MTGLVFRRMILAKGQKMQLQALIHPCNQISRYSWIITPLPHISYQTHFPISYHSTSFKITMILHL